MCRWLRLTALAACLVACERTEGVAKYEAARPTASFSAVRPLTTPSALAAGSAANDLAVPVQAAPALPAGMLAPKFDLEIVSPKGRGTRLRSDQFGPKVLLLFFWASWCENCKLQSPALARMTEQFAGKVKVVGLNTDASLDTARAAASEKRYPFDSVFDHGQVMQTAFRARSLPTTVVVDARGKVAYSVTQVVPEATLVAEIEQALADRSKVAPKSAGQ